MVHEEVESLMVEQVGLDPELEARLREIETDESADPIHAALSARSIAWFLAVAGGIVVAAAIGAVL
ncbi:hypothetical protein [Leucobacter sp. 1207-22]|uniref:hypothetical protein n=1 Tax=Leucobacter sp. 1207-22 TaxID=2604456 RepID=UPI0040649CB2